MANCEDCGNLIAKPRRCDSCVAKAFAALERDAASHGRGLCAQCGASCIDWKGVANQGTMLGRSPTMGLLCPVCWQLYWSIYRESFIEAHNQWLVSNENDARAKRRLLDNGGPFA